MKSAHVRMILPIVSVAFVGTMFPQIQGVSAQTRKVDIKVIQRDVDIMEGVLDRLVYGTKRLYGPDSKTRGTYLEGYGVIFNLAYGEAGNFVLTVSESDEHEKVVEITDKRKDEDALVWGLWDGKGRRKNVREVVNSLKEDLTTFFADYAGATKELRPSDHVTVVVDLNDDSHALFVRSRDETSQVNRLVATSPMSRVIAFKKGALDRDAFRKAIVFTEETGQDKERQDLKILADIFDSALSKSRGGLIVHFSGRTRGMYFPGFGAVFMTNAMFPLDASIGFVPALEAQEVFLTTRAKESPKKADKSTYDEKKKELQDEIVDILARYGGSLRSVPSSESVLVNVDLGEYFGDETLSRMGIKVKMNDIERYNREQLSYGAFTNAVEITEY